MGWINRLFMVRHKGKANQPTSVLYSFLAFALALPPFHKLLKRRFHTLFPFSYHLLLSSSKSGCHTHHSIKTFDLWVIAMMQNSMGEFKPHLIWHCWTFFLWSSPDWLSGLNQPWFSSFFLSQFRPQFLLQVLCYPIWPFRTGESKLTSTRFYILSLGDLLLPQLRSNQPTDTYFPSFHL